MQGRKRVTMAGAGDGDGMQAKVQAGLGPEEAASPRDKEGTCAFYFLFATGVTFV